MNSHIFNANEEQLGGSQSGTQTRAVECLFSLEYKEENSHDEEHASLEL